jgi:hypothetical protein
MVLARWGGSSSLASRSAFEKYARNGRQELFLDEMEQIVPWGS